MALDKDGDTCQVQGSGKKPYVLKNVGGVLSCTCPAWCNQSLPIDRRTCKHLKSVRGDAAEAVRVAAAFTGGAAPAPASFGSPSGRLPTKPPMQNIPLQNIPVRPAARSAPRKTVQTPESFAAGVRAVEMDEDEDEPEASDFNPRLEQDESLRYASVMQVTTLDPIERQRIMARAYDQKRKLRPDEKAKISGPPVLLALPFENEDIDPRGWWMSEKLDGVRAYWNGEKFISRQGNIFYAPDWFTKNLPNHPLDGELWMGRDMFQKTISVVKSIDAGERWRDISYLVFDLPHLKTVGFEKRMDALDVAVRKVAASSRIRKVEQTPCRGLDHLKKELDRLVALGAEGIMLRQPNSIYVPCRSDTLLKVKPWKDAEAQVLSWEPGKGRHLGRLGAVWVRARTTKLDVSRWVEFKLGTGFTDEDRRNPPPIGSTVTFRYMALTDDGVPKGASFVCVRDYE